MSSSDCHQQRLQKRKKKLIHVNNILAGTVVQMQELKKNTKCIYCSLTSSCEPVVTTGDCVHNTPETTMKLINKHGRNWSQRHNAFKAATNVTAAKCHFFPTTQDVLPFSIIITQQVLRPQSHQLPLLIPLLKKNKLKNWIITEIWGR